MENISKYFKSEIDKYIFICNHLDGSERHDYLGIKRIHYSFPIQGVQTLTAVRDVLLSDTTRIQDFDVVLALKHVNKQINLFQKWEDEKEEFKDDRIILFHPNNVACEHELDRVLYGHEIQFTSPPPGECIECKCRFNSLHVFGCNQEECPACGRKLMKCNCL